VLINWRVFGSSGKISRRENSLVTEDFVLGWNRFHYGKCFYNTAYKFNSSSPRARGLHHIFWATLKGIEIPPLNAFGKINMKDFFGTKKNKNLPIQINHYVTKSYKEFWDIKNSRGNVFFKKNGYIDDFFFAHDKPATFPDYSAYKYLVKLKLALVRSESPKVE
jgi:hypothetical protein